MKTTNAVIYYDTMSDRNNPGWVCETDDGQMCQYPLAENDPDAADADLIEEGRLYADGEIRVRR